MDAHGSRRSLLAVHGHPSFHSCLCPTFQEKGTPLTILNPTMCLVPRVRTSQVTENLSKWRCWDKLRLTKAPQFPAHQPNHLLKRCISKMYAKVCLIIVYQNVYYIYVIFIIYVPIIIVMTGLEENFKHIVTGNF